MDIADKIRFLRTNILNISQEKFAKKIDVTRMTVNNLGTRSYKTKYLTYYYDCSNL